MVLVKSWSKNLICSWCVVSVSPWPFYLNRFFFTNHFVAAHWAATAGRLNGGIKILKHKRKRVRESSVAVSPSWECLQRSPIELRGLTQWFQPIFHPCQSEHPHPNPSLLFPPTLIQINFFIKVIKGWSKKLHLENV